MNTKRNIVRRFRNRSGNRGAAMAEGIIVIATMLVFLGTTVFASRAYGGKVDQMTETRKDALFYASHHCDKQAPQSQNTGGVPGTANGAGNGNTGDLDAVSGRLQGGLPQTSATSRDWNMSQSSRSGTQTAQASINTSPTGLNLQRILLTSNISTTSYVGCNEQRYDNNWTALFEFGWDFLKSGAGVAGGP